VMRELAGAGRGAGGHVQRAERGKHAVGVCDDEAGARGWTDEGAGGAGGGAGGHVQCAERCKQVQHAGGGKHAVAASVLHVQRRHLQLLGHTLVRVLYLEWGEWKGACEREQYLRGKLRQCTLEAGKDSGLSS